MDAGSFFFDLIELDNTRAASIVEIFLSNLHSSGFKDEFLLQNWISFGCDGDFNMLGRHAGVAQHLVEMYPNLIVWHCSNHRLEIAVNDIREMSAAYHMKTFFDKLYAVYNASPKNKAKLELVPLQLSIRLNSIGHVLGTRSERAIWKNYPASYKHFHEASMDQNRMSSERAQYVGLKRKLSDANFVLNMGLMLDALTELNICH
jgi:hypothetical protein